MQKLVDLSLWKVDKFPIVHIGDIFNALCMKIEKLKDLSKEDDLLIMLRVLQIIATRTTLEAIKVENPKVH